MAAVPGIRGCEAISLVANYPQDIVDRELRCIPSDGRQPSVLLVEHDSVDALLVEERAPGREAS